MDFCFSGCCLMCDSSETTLPSCGILAKSYVFFQTIATMTKLYIEDIKVCHYLIFLLANTSQKKNLRVIWTNMIRCKNLTTHNNSQRKGTNPNKNNHINATLKNVFMLRALLINRINCVEPVSWSNRDQITAQFQAMYNSTIILQKR